MTTKCYYLYGNFAIILAWIKEKFCKIDIKTKGEEVYITCYTKDIASIEKLLAPYV